MNKPIRFAPLARVSSESQKKKGSSLTVQKEQITDFVDMLGGIISKTCWKYSGQESALPSIEKERKLLDQLLEDADKNKFDAVIVCDTSRWSRDNVKSKQGLEILRNAGIRFFVGTMEYDLYNPEQNFILGMATEINEFQALQQLSKAMQTRIRRAKRGWPVSRLLPVGRTFDKINKVWGIDKKVQKEIKQAAQEYIGGRPLNHIARELGKNAQRLRNNMRLNCGTDWIQKFKVPKLNIDEEVLTPIPRLLPESLIKAVQNKALDYRNKSRGPTKHEYLLSRILRCAHCNRAMIGSSNYKGQIQYYTHKRLEPRSRMCFTQINAKYIESEILDHIYGTFGDIKKIQKAIEDATPDTDKRNQLKSDLKSVNKKLAQIKKSKDSLLDMVDSGVFDAKDVKERMKKHKDRETILIEKQSSIQTQLDLIPSKKEITQKAKMAKNILLENFKSKKHLDDMNFEEKQKFLRSFFQGQDPSGKHYAVYLTYEKEKANPWFYEIHASIPLPIPIGRLDTNTPVGKLSIDI